MRKKRSCWNKKLFCCVAENYSDSEVSCSDEPTVKYEIIVAFHRVVTEEGTGQRDGKGYKDRDVGPEGTVETRVSSEEGSGLVQIGYNPYGFPYSIHLKTRAGNEEDGEGINDPAGTETCELLVGNSFASDVDDGSWLSVLLESEEEESFSIEEGIIDKVEEILEEQVADTCDVSPVITFPEESSASYVNEQVQVFDDGENQSVDTSKSVTIQEELDESDSFELSRLFGDDVISNNICEMNPIEDASTNPEESPENPDGDSNEITSIQETINFRDESLHSDSHGFTTFHISVDPNPEQQAVCTYDTSSMEEAVSSQVICSEESTELDIHETQTEDIKVRSSSDDALTCQLSVVDDIPSEIVTAEEETTPSPNEEMSVVVKISSDLITAEDEEKLLSQKEKVSALEKVLSDLKIIVALSPKEEVSALEKVLSDLRIIIAEGKKKSQNEGISDVEEVPCHFHIITAGDEPANWNMSVEEKVSIDHEHTMEEKIFEKRVSGDHVRITAEKQQEPVAQEEDHLELPTSECSGQVMADGRVSGTEDLLEEISKHVESTVQLNGGAENFKVSDMSGKVKKKKRPNEKTKRKTKNKKLADRTLENEIKSAKGSKNMKCKWENEENPSTTLIALKKTIQSGVNILKNELEKVIQAATVSLNVLAQDFKPGVHILENSQVKRSQSANVTLNAMAKDFKPGVSISENGPFIESQSATDSLSALVKDFKPVVYTSDVAPIEGIQVATDILSALVKDFQPGAHTTENGTVSGSENATVSIDALTEDFQQDVHTSENGQVKGKQYVSLNALAKPFQPGVHTQQNGPVKGVQPATAKDFHPAVRTSGNGQTRGSQTVPLNSLVKDFQPAVLTLHEESVNGVQQDVHTSENGKVEGKQYVSLNALAKPFQPGVHTQQNGPVKGVQPATAKDFHPAVRTSGNVQTRGSQSVPLNALVKDFRPAVLTLHEESVNEVPSLTSSLNPLAKAFKPFIHSLQDKSVKKIDNETDMEMYNLKLSQSRSDQDFWKPILKRQSIKIASHKRSGESGAIYKGMYKDSPTKFTLLLNKYLLKSDVFQELDSWGPILKANSIDIESHAVSGKTGAVYLGKYRNSLARITIMEKERLALDVNILSNLQSLFTSRVVADCRNQEELCLVSLQSRFGTLGDLMEMDPHRTYISVPQAELWMVGILDGLRYLAWKGIVHGDLCPCNILIDDRALPRITGLEFAYHYDGTPVVPADHFNYHFHYAAPERLFLGCKIEPVSDIFSAGCIIHHLIYGRPPFMGSTQEESITKLLTNDIIKYDMRLSPIFAEVLENCLRKCIDCRRQGEPIRQNFVKNGLTPFVFRKSEVFDDCPVNSLLKSMGTLLKNLMK